VVAIAFNLALEVEASQNGGLRQRICSEPLMNGLIHVWFGTDQPQAITRLKVRACSCTVYPTEDITLPENKTQNIAKITEENDLTSIGFQIEDIA
jgi:hypothetical protein